MKTSRCNLMLKLRRINALLLNTNEFLYLYKCWLQDAMMLAGSQVSSSIRLSVEFYPSYPFHLQLPNFAAYSIYSHSIHSFFSLVKIVQNFFIPVVTEAACAPWSILIGTSVSTLTSGPSSIDIWVTKYFRHRISLTGTLDPKLYTMKPLHLCASLPLSRTTWYIFLPADCVAECRRSFLTIHDVNNIPYAVFDDP